MSERACPVCQLPLTPESIADMYGRPLELDRCHRCRGIWFDRAELYRLQRSFAETLGESPRDEAADAATTTATTTTSSLSCVGCTRSLCRLRDPAFPQDLQAWQCPECAGMWLTEQDICAFYQCRQQRLATLRADETMQRTREERMGKRVAELQNDMAAKAMLELGKTAAMVAMPPWARVLSIIAARLAPILRKPRD